MHTCIPSLRLKRSWHSCPRVVNPSNKSTPSMHHPRRRNVTTSLVWFFFFLNGHICKTISLEMVNPRDVAGNAEEEEVVLEFVSVWLVDLLYRWWIKDRHDYPKQWEASFNPYNHYQYVKGLRQQCWKPSASLREEVTTAVWVMCGVMVSTSAFLALCRAQRPKMFPQGCGQNVPKRLVVISRLHCFHTRKFTYNLARISWMITVQNFRYFLPRDLHCLCVQSESERVFERRVEETRCRFPRWVFSMIQTTTNNSMAFVLKILCLEKL